MLIKTFAVEQLDDIIESLKKKVDAIDATKVEDILTSTSSINALSANMGRYLKTLLDNKVDIANFPKIVNNLTSNDHTAVLAASQGKVLKDLLDTKADKVNQVRVINDYSGGINKSLDALSANKGKELYELVNQKVNLVDFPPISSDITTANRTDLLAAGTVIDTFNKKIGTSDVMDNLTSHNASKVLAASQGPVIVSMIDNKANKTDLPKISNNINTAADTDILTARVIKNALSNTKLEGQAQIPQIVDNLTSSDQDKTLSANQGRVLDNKISAKVAKADIIDNLTNNSSTLVLSAKQGKTLNDKIINLSNDLNTKITNTNNAIPVIQDNYKTIKSWDETANAKMTLSARIGKLLKNEIDTKADKSQLVFADTLTQYNAAYSDLVINKGILAQILVNNVNTDNFSNTLAKYVVDNLTTTRTDVPLSARQGYILNNKLELAFASDASIKYSIYVDASYTSGDANGTSAKPYASLQTAINSIPFNSSSNNISHVTIYLKSDITLLSPLIIHNIPWINRLVISGENHTVTITPNSNYGIYCALSSPVQINNTRFIIKSATTYGFYLEAGRNAILSNSWITCNGNVSHVFYSDIGSGVDMNACKIAGNGTSSSTYGITCYRSTGGVISSTTIMSVKYAYNFNCSTLVVNNNNLNSVTNTYVSVDSARIMG